MHEVSVEEVPSWIEEMQELLADRFGDNFPGHAVRDSLGPVARDVVDVFAAAMASRFWPTFGANFVGGDLGGVDENCRPCRASARLMTRPHIPLAQAKLCANCEGISDAKGETCPACGAFANWLSIARLLASPQEKAQIVRAKGVAA